MQLGDGDINQLPHPPIPMYHNDLHIHAAIIFPPQTRCALTAIQIRLNAASIAQLEAVRFGCQPDFSDFDGEFMTQDTRISKERLMPLERMQIRAADTHLPDAHLGLIFAWRWGQWHVPEF